MDGQRIRALTMDANGSVTGDPEDFLEGRYGRLRTVAVDAEGALWITTSNRDGVGTPTAEDDRVLRIQPPSTAGSSPL
jgi:glucose/arabinose dehydrogenase